MTFQFLVVEGESLVFKVSPPEQSSTARHSSEDRISERIVEQTVDISFSGGGLRDFSPRPEFILFFALSSWCS